MRHINYAKFALLLCCTLMLCATAYAQKPAPKSPRNITNTKSQDKKRTQGNDRKALLSNVSAVNQKDKRHVQGMKAEPFKGVIDCSNATKDADAPGAKAAMSNAFQPSNAAAVAASGETVQDIRFCYTKEGSAVLANNVYIQMVVKDEPLLILHTRRNKEWISTTLPVCKIAPEMCEMATAFLEATRIKDAGALDEFFHRFYHPTGEMREIAGVKASLYYMVTEDRKTPVWVDESTTTDGMAWPYIGLTHPVLGGLFFMPINDSKNTLTDFEAQKIMPAEDGKKLSERMNKDFENSKDVPIEVMMGTIRKNTGR